MGVELDWKRKAALDIVNELPPDLGDARVILALADRFFKMMVMDQECERVAGDQRAGVLSFPTGGSSKVSKI